jgi:hypothetical protein
MNNGEAPELVDENGPITLYSFALKNFCVLALPSALAS